MMKLVGIIGNKGSGKTTVGKHLVENHNFVCVRFADKLKQMLRVLRLTDNQIDGDEKELPCELLGGKTPRWAMQSLGTEWGRQLIYFDIWVNATRKHIQNIQKNLPSQNIVVDDIRYDNEAELIKELGGKLILIKRNSVVYDPHSSETGVQDITDVDIIIHNTNSLEMLKRVVDSFVPIL